MSKYDGGFKNIGIRITNVSDNLMAVTKRIDAMAELLDIVFVKERGGMVRTVDWGMMKIEDRVVALFGKDYNTISKHLKKEKK